MTDHLGEAKKELEYSNKLDIEYGYLSALQSVGHALIAIVERLDRVTEHTHTSKDGEKYYHLQVQADVREE